jgi:hypothetical protein
MWGQFQSAMLILDQDESIRGPKGIAYWRPIGLGLSVPIYDEDLWADEQNPFLLRKEEIPDRNRLQRSVLSTIHSSDPVDTLLLESARSFCREKDMVGLGISLRP